MMNRIHPLLIALAGILVLSIMDALIKYVGARFPTFQLVFLRFSLGFLVAGTIWLAVRPPIPNREAIRINLVRGGIGLFTATTFFYALQTLPLAETIAFTFLSPLFLAGFGALLLGEKLSSRLIIALVIGFAGMLVMVLGQERIGTSLPVLGVAAAGLGIWVAGLT